MRLTYPNTATVPALHEELLRAFPAWRGTFVHGHWQSPRLAVQWTATHLHLDVPDDADVAAVEAVLAAHDSTVVTPQAQRHRAAQTARQQDPTTLSLVERVARLEQIFLVEQAEV